MIPMEQLEKLLQAIVYVCSVHYGINIDEQKIIKRDTMYSISVNLQAENLEYYRINILDYDSEFQIRFMPSYEPYMIQWFIGPADEKEFILKMFKDLQILTKDEMIIKDIIE